VRKMLQRVGGGPAPEQVPGGLDLPIAFVPPHEIEAGGGDCPVAMLREIAKGQLRARA